MPSKTMLRKSSNGNRAVISLARDVIFTMFVGGIAAVLDYAFNVIAANRLPEESFAILSAVIGIVYLVQIPSLTLQTYFTNALATDKAFASKRNYGLILREFLSYSIAAMLIVAVFTPFLSKYVEVETQYLILVSLIVMPSIFVPVLRGYVLGLKQVTVYNLSNISQSVIKIVMLLVGLTLTTDPTVPILAFGLPLLIIGVVLALWVYSKLMDNDKTNRPNLDWKYIWTTMLTFFLFNSAFSLDIVLVDPKYRASYAALALLGKIVFFGSIMAASVVFSYIVNSKNRGEKNRFLFIATAMNVAVSFSIIYVYIVFGGLIVETIFEGNYLEIVPFLVPLSLGIAFYSVSYLFVQYILAEQKWIQVILLGITFLLQVVLFHFYNDSLNDAVYNQTITYASIAIVILLYWGVTQRFENSN